MSVKSNTFYGVHWVDPINRVNLDGESVISMVQTDRKRVKLARGGIQTTATLDDLGARDND